MEAIQQTMSTGETMSDENETAIDLQDRPKNLLVYKTPIAISLEQQEIWLQQMKKAGKQLNAVCVIADAGSDVTLYNQALLEAVIAQTQGIQALTEAILQILNEPEEEEPEPFEPPSL